MYFVNFHVSFQQVQFVCIDVGICDPEHHIETVNCKADLHRSILL